MENLDLLLALSQPAPHYLGTYGPAGSPRIINTLLLASWMSRREKADQARCLDGAI